MVLLLLSLALAAPEAPEAPGSPSAPPVASTPTAQVASAERLRRMLGDAPADPLLLRDVLASVDRRHPQLLAAALGVDVAQARFLAAKGAFDPTIGVDGQTLLLGHYGYSFGGAFVDWNSGALKFFGGWDVGVPTFGRQGIPIYYEHRATLAAGRFRLGVEVPLLEGLVTDRERTERFVSQVETERARAALDRLDVSMRQRATVAWVDWVGSGRFLALDLTLFEIADIRQRAVETRVRLGELAALEELRNAQFLESRRASLARADGAFLAAVQGLSLFYRDDTGQGLAVAAERLPPRPRPPDDPLDRNEQALVRLALDVHPDLQVVRAVIAQREAIVDFERNRLLPRVNAFGSVSQGMAGWDVAPEARYSGINLIAGFKGDIPTLNRGARGRTAASRASVDVAKADERWLTEQITASVLQSVARERAALQAWQAATRSVDLALQIQDAEQRRFDLGEIDLLRLWQIEQETAGAIRDEISAWMRYEVARANLVAAVGVRVLPP